MYDVAIIGAGVNGCATAYELEKAHKKIVLFDENGIASGGSGAAGAFIAPKFSKAGELKEILHQAFLYSMDFYETNFPTLFQKSKLLHIAKDEKDDEILRAYKQDTDIEFFDTHDTKRESISIVAGLVNAKMTCEAMAKSSTFVKEKVDTIVFDDGAWVINEKYSAKELVLATGAYKMLIKEPYIQLRGIWGHRIDIQTSTKNLHSIHQFVSISPSKEGELSIGATHNVHYHPQTSTQTYNIDEGREELLYKASQSLELKDVSIVRDYMGLRSGSFDYMPLLGEVVLSHETLKNNAINFKTKKPNFEAYTYYPNLYMINGSGGYGFVLAPYLAQMLANHIVSGRKISPRFSPARFFARWAKKL